MGERIVASAATPTENQYANLESCDVGPTMSVVVMGYRNASTIVDAVRSVVDQIEPGVDLVVVASGPEDGVDAVRTAFPKVAIVKVTERLMPGGTRNRGVAESTGSVVAFLAADCLAMPGWVRGRREAHAAGRPVVAGSVVCAGRATPWGVASWLIGYSNRLPGLPSENVGAGSARRHSLSVDRVLLAEMGGFDEDLRVGEDTILADLLLQRGIPIWFEASVQLAHRGPGGPIRLVRDEFRRGRRLRDHFRATGAVDLEWSVARRTWVKSRYSLAQGWRFGQVSRPLLVASAPFVVSAILCQLLGAADRSRSAA